MKYFEHNFPTPLPHLLLNDGRATSSHLVIFKDSHFWLRGLGNLGFLCQTYLPSCCRPCVNATPRLRVWNTSFLSILISPHTNTHIMLKKYSALCFWKQIQCFMLLKTKIRCFMLLKTNALCFSKQIQELLEVFDSWIPLVLLHQLDQFYISHWAEICHNAEKSLPSGIGQIPVTPLSGLLQALCVIASQALLKAILFVM